MIEIRISPESFIMSKIGLKSFTQEQLLTNFEALMMTLIDKRPDAIKGRYFNRGYIKTSMGPPVKVNLHKYQAISASRLL